MRLILAGHVFIKRPKEDIFFLGQIFHVFCNFCFHHILLYKSLCLQLIASDHININHYTYTLLLQALFARLQQLASVAGDVLLGKEKIQKILLSRLTETVVMWLSEEQEFWDVFKDDSAQLQPLGLQQACLFSRAIVFYGFYELLILNIISHSFS